MVQSNDPQRGDKAAPDLACIAGVDQHEVEIVRTPLAQAAGEFVLAEEDTVEDEPFELSGVPVGEGSFKAGL